MLTCKYNIILFRIKLCKSGSLNIFGKTVCKITLPLSDAKKIQCKIIIKENLFSYIYGCTLPFISY